MPTSALDIPVFDADNHLYETRDALTKFLPDRYKGAIDYVEVRGRTKIVVRGRISEYIPNPTFDVVARPGAQEDYFRRGNPEGKSRREIFGEPMRSIPAFREPAPRLELMDEQGIDRALMFPTLASLVEERMRDDPELTHAAVHALNRWLHETWTFDYEHRIFATPVITLPIVERAIDELEWVIENGSSWVEPLLRNLADVHKKMPQDFLEDPVTVFMRNIHVSPFWEEDLGALAGLIGDERVLFGSDYPHPEGLAEPASYADELAGLPGETVRKIMGGNLARLMNVEDVVVR